MPGVPSGRACEACRQQKKKCDNAQPVCSRCIRLAIACRGSGQKRFLFKGQKCSRQPTQKPVATSASLSPVPPKDEASKLAETFVILIGSSTDCRFNVAAAWGQYLHDLPRRFGTNAALDSAAQALICVHNDFCLQRRTSCGALARYSWALSTLRTHLDDPVKAGSIDTLCAVQLLLICQGLGGLEMQHYSGHVNGALEIMRARGKFNTMDEFECKLLMTLQGQALVHGLFVREIRMNPAVYSNIRSTLFQGNVQENGPLRWLYLVPSLLERGRAVINGTSTESQIFEDEINGIYRASCSLKDELARVLDRGQSSPDSISLGAAYGVTLALCCIFNCMMKALNTTNTYLQTEGEALVDETISFSSEVAGLRPLGAGYIHTNLLIAWACTAEIGKSRLIEELIRERLQDYTRCKAAAISKSRFLVDLARDIRFDTS